MKTGLILATIAVVAPSPARPRKLSVSAERATKWYAERELASAATTFPRGNQPNRMWQPHFRPSNHRPRELAVPSFLA